MRDLRNLLDVGLFVIIVALVFVVCEMSKRIHNLEDEVVGATIENINCMTRGLR